MRAALILLLPLLLNAEERWLQLQSGPFEIFTNAGEKQGKDTLNELEQLRHVLGTTIGQTDLKSVWPIRVVLLKSGKQAASYPELKLGRDAYLSQVTVISPETRAGAVRILLQANAGTIPAALERGLITLFSTLQVEGTRVTLGAKPEHPDRDWSRVHMLSVDPAFSGKLRALLFNLQRGVDAEAAYRNAFEKGPAEIETLLNQYLEAGKYGTVAMSGRPLSAQRQLSAKELAASTAALAQADVLFANGDSKAAPAYTALLKQAPELAPAHEGLGLMAAQASRTADAVRYLEAATRGQTAGARAWLELGRLRTESSQKIALYTKAAQAAPRWAEPWALLGQLEADPARKVAAWKTAAQLDRRNVGYWRALAEAQDAAQLFAEAAKSWGEAERAAETAAEREQIHQARLATDQERVAQSLAQKDAIRRKADQEMQDLKNRALADIRAAETRASRGQAPLNPKTEVIDYKDSLADTKRVEGLLERVDCLGKKARLHIRGPSASMQLLVSDPTKIVISGGGERALGCGPQTPPRLLTVEYTPKPDKKLGTVGEAQFLEFR